MSDVKTQMSWHEDFAKNLSRFFSRSKSVDTEGNERLVSFSSFLLFLAVNRVKFVCALEEVSVVCELFHVF